MLSTSIRAVEIPMVIVTGRILARQSSTDDPVYEPKNLELGHDDFGTIPGQSIGCLVQ